MPQTLVSSECDPARFASASPVFGCTLREGGRDTAWVRVAGELDIATAQQLEQALRVAEIRARRVVLNLRELTFTDSSGVHVIVDASNRQTNGTSTGSRARALADRPPLHADPHLGRSGDHRPRLG
jgi:hypothetical protein